MSETAGKPPPIAQSAPGISMLSARTEHDWRDEIDVEQLAPFSRIVVTTRNHDYEIIVLFPETAEVLVRGGRLLPEFTPARLSGSSLGGSFIKIHSVSVGFRLELAIDRRGPLVTTRVQAIRVIPAGAEHRRALM